METISLKSVLADNKRNDRKTKIVCTLGPACWSQENLLKLIDAGLNVARFNFSHGDHKSHGAALERLKAAAKMRPGSNIAVMLDTKGPEIRTGFLESGDKVTFEKGQALTLTSDYSFKGNSKKLACSYAKLATSVKPGQRVLAADGSLVMEVLSCDAKKGEVSVKCLNSATIGERKNMNLPGVVVDLPTVTEKDKVDILKWAIPNNVDMIAASFVRKGQDVRNIRALLGDDGSRVKIISKIENQEGLENFDSILQESDGIMVARGDLGMELPPEKVFLAQKMMIRKCNVAGKPVITATQMLESMICNPRPTRAECTDVANAVLDGSDCVMLSGETAGGQFPREAVALMASVCLEAESAIRYDQVFSDTLSLVRDKTGLLSVKEAIASSAVMTANAVNAKLIVVLTETGNTARLVAKFRPRQPILVLTPSANAARVSDGLCRGCQSLILTTRAHDADVLHTARHYALTHGLAKVGDIIVAIHGTVEGHTGHTNLLKVLAIEREDGEESPTKRQRTTSMTRCTSGVDIRGTKRE